MKIITGVCAPIFCVFGLLASHTRAADSDTSIDLSITNNTKQLDLPKISGVDQFKVLRSPNINQPFTPSSSGKISGYKWLDPGTSNREFFTLQMQPKDPTDVLTATVLNRLAYGQTPDELDRVRQMGPDAYIQEQLAPETISESLAIDQVNTSSDWQRVTVTGTASSSTLYIYMSGPGDCYIDDIQIVKGSVPDTGVNAVKNGDFETGLTGWTVSTNLQNSAVVTDTKHGGSAALHVVSTQAGSSQASSIYRTDLGLAANQTYTLSYWYKPGASLTSSLVVRLSGSGIVSSPGTLATRLALGVGQLRDLTAWHVLHAVQSRKQLLEVLLQFLDNHFVTQQSKSVDYLDRYYDGNQTDEMATSLEYQELQRWRLALQNPQCTFYDLLKISAESPAMIIYLDTINSRGDGSSIANENYARELMELFTFGVDNGYDQNDITVMSRAWTGWTMRLVDPTNLFNPFAQQTTKHIPGATNQADGSYTIANLDGVWSFAYEPAHHNNSEKIIFPGKTVPPRFGPPYAGRNYELKLSPAGLGNDWIYTTQTGTASSSTLYIYMAGTGDCYIDDISIVPGRVAGAGANAVKNGGFESGLTGWTVSPNLSGSKVSTTVTHSGSGALHLVSSAEGSSQSTSIYRADLGLTSGQAYTLGYWFKPGTNMSGSLIVRLSGSGITSTPGGGTNSIQEGYTVINHLANQPFTQEFISVKLCRLLVHEDFAHGYDFTDPNLSPEGQLVRACMQAWENSQPKGQIRKVLQVIFDSDLFRGQSASMQKVKTPFEFTVSAVRALRADVGGAWTADTDGYSMSAPMNRMGRMQLFNRDTPDGYPEAGAPWISAGTLTERLRFVQSLLIPTGQSGKDDAGAPNKADPVKLLKAKIPQASWKDPDAVASYFVGILFPGEGKANLDEYKTQAVTYLNTADDGVTSSPFSALTDTSSTYDLRVRGLVAMLMTFQRFQEQ